MPTFWKKCPKCGKRFEVEHVAEKVDRTEKVYEKEEPVNLPPPISPSVIPVRIPAPVPEVVGPRLMRVEVVVEDDKYTETYRCKHCGYTWTEEHEELKDVEELGRRDETDVSS